MGTPGRSAALPRSFASVPARCAGRSEQPQVSTSVAHRASAGDRRLSRCARCRLRRLRPGSPRRRSVCGTARSRGIARLRGRRTRRRRTRRARWCESDRPVRGAVRGGRRSQAVAAGELQEDACAGGIVIRTLTGGTAVVPVRHDDEHIGRASRRDCDHVLELVLPLIRTSPWKRSRCTRKPKDASRSATRPPNRQRSATPESDSGTASRSSRADCVAPTSSKAAGKVGGAGSRGVRW